MLLTASPALLSLDVSGFRIHVEMLSVSLRLGRIFSAFAFLSVVISVSSSTQDHDGACEFEARFAEINLTVTCSVPVLHVPQKEYPDLRSFLSFQRPIYDCVDVQGAKYKFGHIDRCWRLERVQSETPDLLECIPSWAVSPLHMNTSSPKITSMIEVKRCVNSPEVSSKLSSFHISDHDHIRNGLTSFYVRFAKDAGTGESYFYGVASRYFVWRADNMWHFSAHWKNVGTNQYSLVRCEDRSGRPAEPCHRIDSESGDLEEFQLSFVFSEGDGDCHASLIKARNARLKLRLPFFTLINGLQMPLFGLGTGGLNNVTRALEAASGYELIDTAAAYENEDIIGEFLPRFNNSVFVQTKVWPTELGYQRTIRSVMESRDRLHMTVLDSVLLHWPKCYAEWEVDWMNCETADPDPNEMLFVESWRALERIYAEGFVLAIGVSNFDMGYMEEIFHRALAISPMLVQNHFSLIHIDQEVAELAERVGMFYQAYSVFRDGVIPESMKEVLHAAMKQENWTRIDDKRGFIIQLMLRTKLGFLSRSNNPSHLAENLNLASQPLEVTKTFFEHFNAPEVDDPYREDSAAAEEDLAGSETCGDDSDTEADLHEDL